MTLADLMHVFHGYTVIAVLLRIYLVIANNFIRKPAVNRFNSEGKGQVVNHRAVGFALTERNFQNSAFGIGQPMGVILDVLELRPVNFIGSYQGFGFPIPPVRRGGAPSAASAPSASGAPTHAASDGVHTLSF